jgi:hypothetical protein
MNYITKQVEAKVLRTNMIIVIVKFLYDGILTKFKCPFTLITNQEVYFINDTIHYKKNGCFATRLATEFLRCRGHLQLTIFIPHEC